MSIARGTLRLIVLLLCALNAAAQPDELSERRSVREQATQAYHAGNFQSLDRQHAAYSDFLRQRTSSGAFKMTLFFDGIAEAVRSKGPAERLQDIERTRDWAKEHGDAPLAHILHTAALQAYGGYFRGSGMSSSVPPQAWKVYEEYTRKAATYLLESEPVAGRSTTWHMWALNIARTAAWPSDVMQRIFEAGVNKDPANYSLYVNALHYLLPKWHGNVQAVDAFIRHAVTRAPPEFGSELYARLYSAAGESQFDRRLYVDSLVDWPRMREGLEAWYQRFPTSWNKNIVAYHACIAGDKTLAKGLLDDVRAQPQWQIWQPNSEATFESCVRWAADPQSEPLEPLKRPTEAQKRAAATASFPAATATG